MKILIVLDREEDLEDRIHPLSGCINVAACPMQDVCCLYYCRCDAGHETYPHVTSVSQPQVELRGETLNDAAKLQTADRICTSQLNVSHH